MGPENMRIEALYCPKPVRLKAGFLQLICYRMQMYLMVLRGEGSVGNGGRKLLGRSCIKY